MSCRCLWVLHEQVDHEGLVNRGKRRQVLLWRCFLNVRWSVERVVSCSVCLECYVEQGYRWLWKRLGQLFLLWCVFSPLGFCCGISVKLTFKLQRTPNEYAWKLTLQDISTGYLLRSGDLFFNEASFSFLTLSGFRGTDVTQTKSYTIGNRLFLCDMGGWRSVLSIGVCL